MRSASVYGAEAKRKRGKIESRFPSLGKNRGEGSRVGSQREKGEGGSALERRGGETKGWGREVREEREGEGDKRK
jgi:hypothetical protein